MSDDEKLLWKNFGEFDSEVLSRMDQELADRRDAEEKTTESKCVVYPLVSCPRSPKDFAFDPFRNWIDNIQMGRT